MIHDDFGVPADRIDEWHRIIREQFVRLHTEFNVLQEFKDAQEELNGLELPELPSLGNLNLADVIESPYFFG